MSDILSHFEIRSATVDDLSQLRKLILDSFLAMTEFQGEDSRERLESAAVKSMDADLVPQVFSKLYFDKPSNHYWVAVDANNNILGCIGLKRRNIAEAEVVRMAVESSLRGKGVGTRLFQTMEKFSKDSSVLRLHIVTANPLSAKFYAKSGAVVVQESDFSLGNGKTVNVFYLVKYFGEKIVRKVAVVGGTHGNERLGVELIRQWVRNDSSLQRSTFKTFPIMGNPEAVLEYRRFVDEDLNRQFTGWMTDRPSEQLEHVAKETLRAYELNDVLGPKSAGPSDRVGVDFVIDLHSSTSSTGVVAMISGIEHDLLARRLCYYLQQEFTDVRICSSKDGKDASYSLDSVPPSGIAIEIGPLCHGLMDSHLLETSRRLVMACLDYIESKNLAILNEMKEKMCADSEGDLSTWNYYAASNSETQLVSANLCSRSIPTVFPPMQYFVRVGEVKYPESNAPIKNSAELMGAENDIYHRSLLGAKSFVLHPMWQGKDWEIIKDGDPLFVASDGSQQIVEFKYEEHLFPSVLESAVSESEPMTLFTLFIDESAYAPRDIAMTLYIKIDGVIY
jgi:N-acetylglutamate synthase-like GNAT family acetyltransferase